MKQIQTILTRLNANTETAATPKEALAFIKGLALKHLADFKPKIALSGPTSVSCEFKVPKIGDHIFYLELIDDGDIVIDETEDIDLDYPGPDIDIMDMLLTGKRGLRNLDALQKEFEAHEDKLKEFIASSKAYKKGLLNFFLAINKG
jgi:CheY-like chemotaxis protein